MGIPLVALMGRQPDIMSGTDQRIRAAQLQGLQNQNAMAPGQQELEQQQIEEQKRSLEQQTALNAAYKNSIRQNDQGQPEIDTDSLSKALAQSGHGSAIPGILKSVADYQKTKNDLIEQQQKIQNGGADIIGHAASAVAQANYDPKVAHTILDTFPPSPQIDKMRQMIDSDPAGFKQAVDSAVAQSPAQQTIKKDLDVAKIRAQGAPKEGEIPLSQQQLDQLNAGLTSRYAVLHGPNVALPSQFTLQEGATQKDFDRVDKLLGATENATTAKTARDAAAGTRADAAADRKQNQQDREEKDAIQPVSGIDPKTGREVLVSMGDAKKMGLTGTMKADADLVNKSHAARTWLKLADKTGDSPDSMGLVQLVDKLDKEGKLGVVASRWNDFLSGKLGAGDPAYTALRTKMGLSTTKLMQAHVGSRGGAFMMEHFEDLANAGKMNASTLRQGILSELNYMKDVAMLPDSGGSTSSGNKPPTFAEWKAKQNQ